MTFQISSDSFEPGDPIPTVHTCEGRNTSPGLSWSGAPPETRSLALIVDDPDAPDPEAPKRVFVHWVLYDIPADAASLPAAATARTLPEGAREGLNDRGQPGYVGPCPPIGRHRYFHKLFALDTTLGDLGRPTKADLLDAMEGHVLATAELVGTYQKQR
jgi:Raf kinase inhibitor-like YbhB/YbcL family protein